MGNAGFISSTVLLGDVDAPQLSQTQLPPPPQRFGLNALKASIVPEPCGVLRRDLEPLEPSTRRLIRPKSPPLKRFYYFVPGFRDLPTPEEEGGKIFGFRVSCLSGLLIARPQKVLSFEPLALDPKPYCTGPTHP